MYMYVHVIPFYLRCEVFRAMFATAEKPTEESQPSPLVLSEINPNIFLAMLEFIYTNCCSLSTDMVMEIISVSSICIIHMYMYFSLQVIEVLAISIEYGLDGLTKVKICTYMYIMYMYTNVHTVLCIIHMYMYMYMYLVTVTHTCMNISIGLF